MYEWVRSVGVNIIRIQGCLGYVIEMRFLNCVIQMQCSPQE